MATETLPPPPKKSPPPPPPAKSPPANNGAPSVAPTENRKFEVSTGTLIQPLKAVIFGTGGIGKSELAANISQLGLRPLFFDIGKGSGHLEVSRVKDLETYSDWRDAMHSPSLIDPYDVMVFDDLTTGQELCEQWVIANIKHEKGKTITGIEDYGWGKGYVHVYEAFLRILGDFDALIRRGKHVISICHECLMPVTNPSGENYKRYEPRLQTSEKGKDSVRNRLKEWCEHLLFVDYDIFVNDDGKAKGAGSRTIYVNQSPYWWAKSRTLSKPIVYKKGSADLWSQLLNRSE